MSRVGLVLVVVFLAVHCVVATGQYEGSWGGFLLFLLALPASWVALWIESLLSGSFVVVAALLAALWRYGLGALAERRVRHLLSRPGR